MRIQSKLTLLLATLSLVAGCTPTTGAEEPVPLLSATGEPAMSGEPGYFETDDGLLMQGVTSKQKFQSFKLHMEYPPLR